MAWCLRPEFAEKFKKALTDGKINPDKLTSMTSAERKKYLEQFVGKENVKEVNTEFEKKLLLKNQQRGLITWAKKFSGLKEESRKDIVAKIMKMEKAFTDDGYGLLSDAIEKRIGVGITDKEAGTLMKLSKEAEKLYNPAKGEWEQSMDYAKAFLKVTDFIKNATPNVGGLTKAEVGKKFVANMLSVARALKTGFDFSASGRQGLALFGTKEWGGAFKRQFGYAKNQMAFDELRARMMTHKYSKEAMQFKKELGLTAFGESMISREEQYASKLTEKVPFLHGSERAFEGFLNDLRFNRFVNTLERLEKAGNGITGNKEAMKQLAEVISASTGRGQVGSGWRGLSTVLFSPRWIKSRLEILTNPVTKSGAARTEAIKSLARTAGVAASFLGMLKLAGAEVELDTRSADFGKAKFGNTRFDATGGMAPYIVLLSRLGTMSTKTSTGEVKKLNTGKFGAQTAFDTVMNFMTSKTSPTASIVRDVLKGKTFDGKPLKPGANKEFAQYVADQLFMPLVGSDIYNIYKDSGGDIKLTSGAAASSMFGVGVSNYNPETDWTISESKELKQLKEKIGEDEFKKANEEYNKLLDEKMKKVVNDDRYKSKSEDERAAIKTKAIEIVKEEIFKKYNFKYKQDRKSKSELKEINDLVK